MHEVNKCHSMFYTFLYALGIIHLQCDLLATTNDSCHMSRDIVWLLFGVKCRQHVLLLRVEHHTLYETYRQHRIYSTHTRADSIPTIPITGPDRHYIFPYSVLPYTDTYIVYSAQPCVKLFSLLTLRELGYPYNPGFPFQTF